MGSVSFKINGIGVREILNWDSTQDELLDRAQRIKAAADGMGSGTYVADVQAGRNRAHAMVKTADAKSAASNAKHNSLLKSMDAGR